MITDKIFSRISVVSYFMDNNNFINVSVALARDNPLLLEVTYLPTYKEIQNLSIPITV